MAHHKSAIKRIRQSEERRQRNRARRTTLRNAVKSLREQIEQGAPDKAREQLVQTAKVLDQSAGRGIIHRNTAARLKSRLARKVRALGAPKTGQAQA